MLRLVCADAALLGYENGLITTDRAGLCLSSDTELRDHCDPDEAVILAYRSAWLRGAGDAHAHLVATARGSHSLQVSVGFTSLQPSLGSGPPSVHVPTPLRS